MYPLSSFVPDYCKQSFPSGLAGARRNRIPGTRGTPDHFVRAIEGRGRFPAPRLHASAAIESPTDLEGHHRIRWSSSTESRGRKRKMATMMASPTATSAAATHSTKNTSACPSAVPCRWPKATRARLAALSMSSMDMKMMSGSRRMITPSTPRLNSTADSATYQEIGAMSLAARLALGQRHHSDDGHQEQQGGHLEREQVVREQELPEGGHAARRGSASAGAPRERRAQHEHHENEEHPHQRRR